MAAKIGKGNLFKKKVQVDVRKDRAFCKTHAFITFDGFHLACMKCHPYKL